MTFRLASALGIGVVAAAAGMVALRRPVPDPLATLQTGYRTVEARLTAFDYAPFRVGRGDRDSDWLRLTVASEAQKALRASRTPTNLQRAAIAQLSIAPLEKTLDLLTEAAALDPTNAAVLSDLAAAQLASGRPGDAAETSARSLVLDPSLKPAAFNWALSLERLGNRPVAIKAWQQFLNLDGTSGWSLEGRQHLTRLQRRPSAWKRDQTVLENHGDAASIQEIVARYPGKVRYWIQDHALSQCVERRSAADLEVLCIVVNCAKGSAPYILELLRGAENPTPGFIAGVRAFAAATEASGKHDVAAAADGFATAADQLRKAGSPLALQADIFAASNDNYRGRSGEALARVERVIRAAEEAKGRYDVVAAEAWWARGIILSRLSFSDEVLRSHQRALALASAAGEIEIEAAIISAIVTYHERVGDYEEAEKSRTQSLLQLEQLEATPDRLYVSYLQAAYAALRGGRPRLALAFIEAQREIAQGIDDPLLLAESSAEAALALRDLSQHDRAVLSITAARGHAARVKEVALRDRIASDIEYISGTLDASTAPQRSIASHTAALATWQKYGWRIRAASGLLARAEAYLYAGDRAAAERDLRAGIVEMESERAGVNEPALRVAYFESSERLFTTLIALLLESERTDEALSVAERKRAREILDATTAQVSNVQAVPLDARQIAASVPASTTLLDYAVLDDRLAAWAIRRNAIWYSEQRIARRDLAAMVQRQRAAIISRDFAATRREAATLYKILIAPLAAHIAPGDAVVTVADGPLHALSFAALAPDSSSWMIEHHAMAAAPSATIFLAGSGNPLTANPSVVTVAEPAPNGLVPLPWAESEATAVADMYRNGARFIGRQLTPAAFLTRAASADIVQFSGHGVVDARRPSRSALIFEAEGEQPLALTASQIAATRLRARPLVILSACGTGTGKIRRNEGVDSVAAAFLRAGARGVVATLWDIDDDAAKQLFVAFHKQVRNGTPASEALHRAQLGLLQSSDPSMRTPAAWAAPVLLGNS